LKGLVEFNRNGHIMAKDGRTAHPKIFAGGDVVLGSATVAHAVGHGMNTARRIEAHLRHIPTFIAKLLRKTYQPKVKMLPIKQIERIKIPHRAIEERKGDFKEVELWASKDELIKEASRCLSCPLRYHPH
jgi:NADPH-dependent glutamate synthase beta subunit-like oxidoreductase